LAPGLKLFSFNSVDPLIRYLTLFFMGTSDALLDGTGTQRALPDPCDFYLNFCLPAGRLFPTVFSRNLSFAAALRPRVDPLSQIFTFPEVGVLGKRPDFGCTSYSHDELPVPRVLYVLVGPPPPLGFDPCDLNRPYPPPPLQAPPPRFFPSPFTSEACSMGLCRRRASDPPSLQT